MIFDPVLAQYPSIAGSTKRKPFCFYILIRCGNWTFIYLKDSTLMVVSHGHKQLAIFYRIVLFYMFGHDVVGRDIISQTLPFFLVTRYPIPTFSPLVRHFYGFFIGNDVSKVCSTVSAGSSTER